MSVHDLSMKARHATGTNVAAVRAGIKRTVRRHSSHRLGLRLSTLLHAQSLLDGSGSAAHAMALIEDDYHRLRTPVGS